MSQETFKVTLPEHMEGSAIKAFQQVLKRQFKTWQVEHPLKADGVWGVASRDACRTAMYGLGIEVGKMAGGVTPELRTKIRNKDLTDAERKRFNSKQRKNWRRRLQERFKGGGVHRPVGKVLTDSWGYTPASGSNAGKTHDGIDVGCKANAPLYAMVKMRIFDVRSGGWWGASPSGNVTLGDGIIQGEVLENIGPFRKGMHIGYGHAEHATVSNGQVVEAGDMIGKAGLAVVYHVHLMINDGSTGRGIGNINPRKCLAYTKTHG